MSEVYIITSERYSQRSWKQPDNYSFAESDVICPIAWHELPLACMGGPIAFAHNEERGFYPVLLQGFESNRNLYISNKGKWLGRYVPEAYRYYPFVVTTTENGENVLCFNEESGLVSDCGDGEPFYFKDNIPNPKLQLVMKALNKHISNEKLSDESCKRLSELGLITNWPVRIQLESRTLVVEGLSCISQTNLKELSPEQLSELRDSTLLPAIYCQLLSMNHLQFLVESYRNRSNSTTAELDFEALNKGETLNFDNI